MIFRAFSGMIDRFPGKFPIDIGGRFFLNLFFGRKNQSIFRKIKKKYYFLKKCWKLYIFYLTKWWFSNKFFSRIFKCAKKRFGDPKFGKPPERSHRISELRRNWKTNKVSRIASSTRSFTWASFWKDSRSLKFYFSRC